MNRTHIYTMVLSKHMVVRGKRLMEGTGGGRGLKSTFHGTVMKAVYLSGFYLLKNVKIKMTGGEIITTRDRANKHQHPGPIPV